MLTVNVSKPWYSDRGLRVLDEIQKSLSRHKRMIVLIISGILVRVSIIASATTSALASAQEFY